MGPMMDDLRNGLRALFRRPGFSIAVIILLGLGIGATAAVFSLVDAYLLRPLPYADSARIVVISQGRPASRERSRLTPDQVFLIEGEAQSFDLLANYVTAGRIGFDLGGGQHPERVQGGAASSTFFTLLGARPILGRTFTEEDEAEGDPVVLLSYALWKRRFRRDPGVLGRQVPVSGTPRKVIGVLPADFGFSEVEAWVPQPILLFQAEANPVLSTYGMLVLGRLREGVTLEQAREEMKGLARSLESIDPYAARTGMTFLVQPLRDFLLGELRVVIWVLFGAVALVLLITCTNLSNLLLGRLIARQPELTVRSVLGASRGRLARQLLFECLLLGLAAGLIGILIGKLALDLLVPLASSLLPRGAPPGFDLRTLGILLGTATACGVLSGVAPVLRRTERLMEAGPAGASLRGLRLWGALVVAQLALSFVLLAGEGLMLRSFQSLVGRDLGFDPSNILTFTMFLNKHEYPTKQERFRFLDEVTTKLEGLPGALSVAVADAVPIDGGGTQVFVVRTEDESQQDVAALPTSHRWYVSPSFFRTLGIPLRAGRLFTEHDDDRAQRIILVDEDLARRTWPGETAVGKRLKLDGIWREVVGVVGRVENSRPHMDDAPLMYMPLKQIKLLTPIHHVILRTQGNALDSVPAVLAAVREANPDQTVYDVTTMGDRLADSTSRERLVSLVLGLFALVGLSLALSGVFAIIRFALLQRRREVGIRIALGADREDILKLVLFDSLRLIALGLICGAAMASIAAQALSRLVYGVTPGDLPTLAAAAVALATAALIAALLPGVEVLRSDPVLAIRSD